MTESDDLKQALDALEGMVLQYLDEVAENKFDHQCMTAGEDTADVLVQLRPERWQYAGRGIRYTGKDPL